MSGAIPPFPNALSWRVAQLKLRDKFTFTFYIASEIFVSSEVLLL
jgi:hypothetical protein